MIEKNYTQEKMAKKMDITTQSLNAKINGRKHFTLDEVIKIIDILDIKDPIEIFFN